MKIITIEILNSLYDLINFLRFSFKYNKLRNKSQFLAYLTKQYHILEKGMSLPNPRKGFGEQKIKALINTTTIYIEKYGEDSLTQSIMSTLKAYIEFNLDYGHRSDFIKEIELYIENKSVNDTGGIRKITKIGLINTYFNFEDFFLNRRSIRDFDDTEVHNSVLLKAIDVAKYSPSVCNRQGWKVHIFKGLEVQRILELQYGTKGFSDSVKALAIITGDISYFSTFERNQIGIDAGIFSLAYILALHNLGLGTCALNACLTFRGEKRIKQIAAIPKNEKIAMFLAIGNIKNEYYVAKSERRDSETFITFH